MLAGIGFALSGASILLRVFARTAVLISRLFLFAGLAAVFATAGLILASVMPGVEAIWIPAAAITLAEGLIHEPSTLAQQLPEERAWRRHRGAAARLC